MLKFLAGVVVGVYFHSTISNAIHNFLNPEN